MRWIEQNLRCCQIKHYVVLLDKTLCSFFHFGRIRLKVDSDSNKDLYQPVKLHGSLYDFNSLAIS